MDNPGQHLIHLTSRGPSVYNSFGVGGVGEFKVMAKQPLKDINKFGMLHYSVPKMCDHVVNETFELFIKFADGNEIVVPVLVLSP